MTQLDDPAQRPASPDHAVTALVRRPWFALIVLMLPVLLVSVDNTVLAFAIPQITGHLRPTSAQLLWMVDIYPLILAALLVPMGALADRYGRRRMLLWGSAGFALVSVGAAFAPTAAVLILARAAMAIFGAALMPSTLSLIRNIFTDDNQRRLAIAIWAAGFAAGAALGPIVGGFLLEHFHWGSIFLMSVPILAPLLILGPILLPESKDPHPGAFDLLSVGLIIATMAPIVYGITEFATGGAPLTGAAVIAAGLVFGVLFVRRQLTLESPLLDVRLFSSRVFTGSVLVNLISVFALVGFLFFVTQDLQLVIGLSPMEAGMVLLPGLAATVLAGLAVVPILARVRPGIVVAVAFGFASGGYGLVALLDTTPTVLMIAFAVLGIGIGAGETVSNDLILASAPVDQAGAASAISETAYEVGAVFGTAVIGGLITAHFRNGHQLPVGVAASDATGTLGGVVALAEEIGGPLGAELLASAQAAFASGVWLTAGIGTLGMILAAVVGASMLRPVTS